MWVKLEHPHYLIRDGGILYFDEISAPEIQEINKYSAKKNGERREGSPINWFAYGLKKII